MGDLDMLDADFGKLRASANEILGIYAWLNRQIKHSGPNSHDGEAKMQNQDDAAQYTCLVCQCDDFTAAALSRLECGHYLCEDCMVRTIDDHINNGRSATMTCHYRGEANVVSESCGHLITAQEVQRFMSPERYAVYQTKLLQHSRKMEGAVDCPNPQIRGGCGNMVLPAEDGSTRRECLFCNYAFCANCRVMEDSIPRYAAWTPQEHANLTCEAFQRIHLLQNDRYKQCPGLRCQEVIEKNEGCNHMTCATCNHEFCWTCLHPHTNPKWGSIHNARNPPPPNAKGACNGCDSSICGTERRKIYPNPGPLVLHHIPSEQVALIQAGVARRGGH